jgi:hypothetical protein
MAKIHLVIDIETVGFSDDEVNPKILAYHQERWNKKQDVDIDLEKAISWTLGKIICISTARAADNPVEDPTLREVSIKSFVGADERRILSDFWHYLSGATPFARETQFVGFNSLSFDFPFIRGRSAILGIKPTIELPLRRYDPDHHYDVRMILTNWGDRGLGNLSYWGEAFGIRYDPAVCVSEEVGAKFLAGDFEAIRLHCEEDVRITWELYKKLTFL